MQSLGNRWAIVLAAGAGSRLADVTRRGDGVVVPKQYATFWGDRCLLTRTLERARRVVPPQNVVTVVAAEHDFWWRRHLRHERPADVIVQPSNRGTAAGVALPLLEVLRRDPLAQVVVLPSDHYVADEELLDASLDLGLDGLRRGADAVTLLGAVPEGAVPDYGWIVPGPGWDGGVRRVARFVEKPGSDMAESLRRAGGVWNTFLFLAQGRRLRDLFEARLPGLVQRLESAQAAGGDALERLYATLESRDFSRDVLQGSEQHLRLLTVPPCGWTDLGTPERLAACLAELRAGAGQRAPARYELPAGSPANAEHAPTLALAS